MTNDDRMMGRAGKVCSDSTPDAVRSRRENVALATQAIAPNFARWVLEVANQEYDGSITDFRECGGF